MRNNAVMSAQTEDAVVDIERRIASVMSTNPKVMFVYLFGSTASGTAHSGSDVDLAVLTYPGGSLRDDARLQDDLAAALMRDVDLVILRDAPLWLQFRAVGGRVVFSRDETARIAFRERVEKEFLDFRPYHDSYLQAVRERARRGRLTVG